IQFGVTAIHLRTAHLPHRSDSLRSIPNGVEKLLQPHLKSVLGPHFAEPSLSNARALIFMLQVVPNLLLQFGLAGERGVVSTLFEKNLLSIGYPSSQEHRAAGHGFECSEIEIVLEREIEDNLRARIDRRYFRLWIIARRVQFPPPR